ncbi:MAG: Kae1-associated serine/threonine protein kinase [Candidatus Aenigmarchaeota archaeon]|nr:Kae1-associated serine/threonine protein kinase [Candidatus Aenigmarchaeota archaeon]
MTKKKIVARGAEAVLYSETYEGADAISKERVEKAYRQKEIDSELRKDRTKRESRLLEEASRIGVPVPKLMKMDVESARIIMEDIKGSKLKDSIGQMTPEEQKRLFRILGKEVAKLHSKGIVHGDLTTSNVLIRAGSLVIIDFGLGSFTSRIEDMAMDLILLKDVLRSSHPEIDVWNSFIEGYSFGKKEMVLNRLKEVEKRGRYTDKS